MVVKLPIFDSTREKNDLKTDKRLYRPEPRGSRQVGQVQQCEQHYAYVCVEPALNCSTLARQMAAQSDDLTRLLTQHSSTIIIITIIKNKDNNNDNYNNNELVQKLGRRATIITGDSRETTYLFQQLSVAVQTGNADSFQNTFTAGYIAISLLQ